MQSTDPGHFFQTTTALDNSARKAAKSKNKHGDPIQLPSKILAVIKDPRNGGGKVFVAEAAGCVKGVDLETKKILTTFTGPTAPLTSLALSLSTSTLYASSWDKTIWSWSLDTQKPSRRFTGHTDFVKTLLCTKIGDREYLVSGSADTKIIVWDIETGNQVYVCKGHTRAVLSLAVDPGSPDENENDEEGAGDGSITIFSSSSDINIHRWRIPPPSPTSSPSTQQIQQNPQSLTPLPTQTLTPHSTSINSLTFSQTSGDLYTASSDNTALALSRTHGFSPDTTLSHPDFVRAIVVDDELGWIVTACRDEEVRLWEKGSGELKVVFQGHWEEVTGLCLCDVENGEGKREKKVVSVGIDGTVRQWPVGRREVDEWVRKVEEGRKGVVKEDGGKKESLLTEEEERELAELMGSDEE
ncbi:WD40 repeat-like protein [Sporormia fimetaria CBS 119925]|uniref:WD40 repeat-like protein n=1 Tax=Sporormia fimetaria CBS 119925 TaxID=1340428 RepID=A0A6A6V182_9PLEO|nr:WD40 repeat-like protein [Sporormia fimetaria CBS 119925]